MELTPSMKALAEQKLAVLTSHIQQKSRREAVIRIVMNKAQEPDKLLAKIEAKIEGKTYFGDEADYTLESALIRAIDEVDKQYLKDKAKTKERDYGKKRELKRFDMETADDTLTNGDLDLNQPA